MADLLKAGADVSAIDNDGMTALHGAAANGHTRAAGELIWGHANVIARREVSYYCQVPCVCHDVTAGCWSQPCSELSV